MSRARHFNTDGHAMRAAADYEEGGGCLSGFIFIPFVVVLISFLLGSFAWKTNQPSALHSAPVTLRDVSPIFRAEVRYWAGSISKWSADFGLDPNLVATIMQIESCGDPRAKSSAGAMGLFQVMPFHFQSLDNPYDPDTNATRGLAYLSRSLAAGSGDARLALAGYNGGIGVISRAEWTWSAQTQRYIKYGVPIYEDARSGLSSSAALNEWYQSYGVSLCRQASQRLGLQ
jgi:soluble lytic murein transglycosylase-like protein